jgi:hypothetical protein
VLVKVHIDFNGLYVQIYDIEHFLTQIKISKDMRNDIVRGFFYVYFWLIIFEGALRRWIFPSASDLILFIRDPIAICIFFLSFQLFFEKSVIKWTVALFFIGLSGVVLTMLGGHQDWLLTLWGARVPLLHLPLIFIMPQVLKEDDFWKFQKYTFMVAVPIVIFMILQFFMPPEHWSKIGAGGQGTADFLSFGDKTRPSSIFSFINGLSNFFLLLSAFFFSTIIDLKKKKSSFFCWLVPLWLLLGIVFSIGQRQLVYGVLISAFSFYLTSFIYKKLRFNLSLIFVSVIFISALVSFLAQYKDVRYAYELTSERIDSANLGEGAKGTAVYGRGDGGLFSSFMYRMRLYEMPTIIQDLGFFGRGLGYKTNAAKYRLSEKDLIRATTEEGEESAILYTFYEYGIVIGLIFLLWKIFFTLYIFYISFKNILRKKNPQGLIFFFSNYMFIITQLEQPTALGFVVFTAGLCLMANKVLEY